jgi:uncharacterized protein (DUF427 family)
MTRVPDWLRAARSGWRYTGQDRPHFAEEPGTGQESVWDYPRPPVLVSDSRRVVVRSGTITLADTTQALRLLETASPPTFYLPPHDVRLELLTRAPGSSLCEWKGSATFWALVDDPDQAVAWSYPEPFEEYASLRDHISFYPGRVECYVEDERVRPQPGGFYGGWITSDVVGPFKGEPGTSGW